MKSNYKKLGPYIREVNIRNSNLEVDTLLGVSIKKEFMPSIANIVGTNMKTYKIVKKNQFAYGPVTSRNGDKISVALLEDYDIAIVSQAYTVFEVKDEKELLPEYLMMWMRRPEFDRYARFKSHGSAREVFDWEEMCEVELPIPSPTKQQEIVNEYNTVQNRIDLNQKLIKKLEEAAQAVYKEWFVEFEFPTPSPPLEGCPQDGVVDIHDHTNTKDTYGVVDIHDHTNTKDSPKLKRNSVNYFSLPYNPNLRQRAKELRKAGNLAEVLFWKQVRNKSFKGLDFDRQKIIGNYIVDFYCSNYQLVVEIDGASHNGKEEYDAKRDAYLESLGLTVIHFTDYQIKNDMDGVMKTLSDHPKLQNAIESEDFHTTEPQSTSVGEDFHHPVLRTPLQRRGTPQKGYKSSGGKMIYNEELEKEIPEGWKIGNLSEIATIIMGQSPPGETYNKEGNGMIFYQGRTDFGYRFPSITTYTTHPKRKAIKSDILISVRAPVGDLNITICDCAIGRGVGALRSRLNCNSHLFYVLQNLKSHFDISDGIGTIFGSINKDDLHNMKVVYSENKIKIFEKIAQPIDDCVKNYCIENKKLYEIKDLLLSKLATINNQLF